MEDWLLPLQQDRPDEAWDRFLARYRKLLFATIRHFTTDPDDGMDLFVHACDRLQADGMARLRRQAESGAQRAKFSTWLVAVTRNLVVDWYRHRDGRPRLSVAARALTARQQRVYELVFLQSRPHLEAYGVLESAEPGLPFRDFLADLRAAHGAAARTRSAPALLPPPPELPDQLAHRLEHEERRRVLAALLDGLDPVDRAVVQLYVVEGLSAEQVATVADLPSAKAVYNRAYRLLADLRARLVAQGLDGGAL